MTTRWLTVLGAALLAGVALSAQAQSAGPSPQDAAFRAFLKCDDSFFRMLVQTPGALGPTVAVAARGNAAAPVTGHSPTTLGGAEQRFTAPLALGIPALTLTGWHSEVIDQAAEQNTLLFWGFQVAATPQAVVEALRAVPDAAGRLSAHGSGLWARSEMRWMDDDRPNAWHTGGAPGPTPKGMVERVLMVRADPAHADGSTIYCSLQGALTGRLLRSQRPDLIDSEYPPR